MVFLCNKNYLSIRYIWLFRWHILEQNTAKSVKDVVQRFSKWSRSFNQALGTIQPRPRMIASEWVLRYLYEQGFFLLVTKINMVMYHGVLIMKVDNLIVWPTMVDLHGRSSRTGSRLRRKTCEQFLIFVHLHAWQHCYIFTRSFQGIRLLLPLVQVALQLSESAEPLSHLNSVDLTDFGLVERLSRKSVLLPLF